jgi:hypothetical protein
MLVSGKEVQALPSSSPGHDSFQTGKNHISQEKWIEAAKSFIDAAIFILSSMGKEEAAGESKRREEVGLCYHTAGYAMSHINEKEALGHLRGAIYYYKQAQRFSSVAACYHAQGLLYKRISHYNESIICYDFAYNYYLLDNCFELAISMLLSTVLMHLMNKRLDRVYDILYNATQHYKSYKSCRHIIMDMILLYLLNNQLDDVYEWWNIFSKNKSTKRALLRKIIKYTMKLRRFNDKIYNSIDFIVLEEHTKALIYALDYKVEFEFNSEKC